MKIFLVLVVVAFIAWKGYFAVRRAVRSYKKDREEHDSLREYLVANGATTFQSLWPFYRHALQRAFKMAGVQTILMSLWPVDDAATQLMMTEFYRRWIGNKESKREAFSHAQNIVKQQYADPKYWAAFILLD